MTPWITEGDGTRTFFDPVARRVAAPILAPEVRPVTPWVPPVVVAPPSIGRVNPNPPQTRTLPWTPPGAGYGNIGGGGEESQSKEASDHVDDYGNTPATPPVSWPGNNPHAGMFPLPMEHAPRPAPAVPTPVTPENTVPPWTGKNLWDRVTPGNSQNPGELFDGFKMPDLGGFNFPGLTIPGLFVEGKKTVDKVTEPIGDMMQMLMLMMVLGSND